MATTKTAPAATVEPWNASLIGDEPRVRVSFSQLATGAWRAERTIEFPALDMTLAENQQLLTIQFDRLDEAIRAHMQLLYERDQQDRDEYFRQRDERDRNGSYRR